MKHRLAPFLLVLALLGLVSGCAGHAERTAAIRSALDVRQPGRALALINKELGVESADELPKEVGGANALLILDRAMVLQQLGRFELSSRDLEVADKQIEVLDLSRNALDSIGRYIFSDDVGVYKAPAYEKLLVNTMNLVNYLVRGDLSGARVEARRLAVMQRYIKEHEDPADALLGPGSYLAGFTFEKSGRPDEALKYYDEALTYSDYVTLREPICRLAGGAGSASPRIRRILEEHADRRRALEPVLPSTEDDPGPETNAAGEADWGELLVIVSFGRVPAKYAQRVPIGLALTYASNALAPTDYRRANMLAAQGLVTWVNYPELGKPRGEWEQPEFALNGEWQLLEGALAVDAEVVRAWEQARGAVVASAITRMISRVVAGEAVRRGAGEGLPGFLLSLGTQATLTAFDTPDTRSWSTLPARIAFGRIRVPPGEHTVYLGARGAKRERRVVVKPRGFAAVALTALN